MRKSDSRIKYDISRIHSDPFAELCRNGKKNVFVRNRKMPLDDLTFSIGLLKSDLIYILLEKDPRKQDELFQNLYDEISENIVPVRPDRHYPRTKGQLAGNYSNTHKRSY